MKKRKNISYKRYNTKPHDNFFKELFSDIETVRLFLDFSLPEKLKKELSLEDISINRTNFVDKRLKEKIADLFIKVKTIFGEEVYVYILIEHKSYRDKMTISQILNYISIIYERDVKENKEPRLVIPMLFYNGKTRYEYETEFQKQFKKIPEGSELLKLSINFKIIIFDLNRIPVNKLEKELSKNSKLMLSLIAMQRKVISFLKNSFTKIKKETILKERELIKSILNYLSSIANEVEEKEIKELIEKIDSEELMEDYMTVSDAIYNRGIKEKAYEIAKKMLEDGVSLEFIKKYVDISEEEINRLKNDIK